MGYFGIDSRVKNIQSVFTKVGIRWHWVWSSSRVSYCVNFLQFCRSEKDEKITGEKREESYRLTPKVEIRGKKKCVCDYTDKKQE